MAFFISVKQNLSYAWSLGPHTLVKLTLNGIFISLKQNISYTWSLGPHTLVKLTLNGIFISVKQNLNYAQSLRPHTLIKLTPNDIFISTELNLSNLIKLLKRLAMCCYLFLSRIDWPQFKTACNSNKLKKNKINKKRYKVKTLRVTNKLKKKFNSLITRKLHNK